MSADAAAVATAAPAPRCLQEADFERIPRAEYLLCLTDPQFRSFRRAFVGKPLPAQRLSDEVLVEKGYNREAPWADYYVRLLMPNWV